MSKSKISNVSKGKVTAQQKPAKPAQQVKKPQPGKASPKPKKEVKKVSKSTPASKAPEVKHFSSDFSMISMETCENVARIDAKYVSTKVDKYVKANTPTYFILLNTWLLQIAEYSEIGAYDVRDAVQRVGLLAVIQQCQDLANAVLTERLTLDNVFAMPELSGSPTWLCSVVSGCEDIRSLLQLLRYPKRFSPAQADLVLEKGISLFESVNSCCGKTKNNFYCETPQRHLARKLRPYVERMCRRFRVDYERDGFFSSGVAADSERPLADKLNAYSAYAPFLSTPLYSLGYGGTIVQDYYGKDMTIPLYLSEVRAVPKSYKIPRIIAMEDAYRQYHMQAIRIGLERCLKLNGFEKYLTLHDQDPNRELCELGSIDESYSTIDMSSASDSINRALVWNLFPSRVFYEMTKYLPTHYTIEVQGRKQKRKMFMFCTSGSALTFIVESMVFLSVALLATDTVGAYLGEKILPPHVYGDDIVIDSRAFATALDMLDTLHFTVNAEKSFSSGTQYRESCGVEYCGGFDTSTRYFPRTTYDWRKPITCLDSLISLEKKFYSSWKIRRFLCDIVRGFEPRMTSSDPGTECSDLWEPIPYFKEAVAPWDHEKSKPTIPDLLLAREKHLVPDVRWGDNLSQTLQPSNLTRLEIVELWLYYKWLQNGGSYEDELMEILNITEKPARRQSLTNNGSVKWTFTDV